MTVVITLMNQLSAMQFELNGAGDGQLCSHRWERCSVSHITSQPAEPVCAAEVVLGGGEGEEAGGGASAWKRSVRWQPACLRTR